MKLKTTCDWCGRVFEREASELKGKNIIFAVGGVLQIIAINPKTLMAMLP